MKWTTLSALFFAASISLAIAYPARNYYYEDEEYSDGKALIAPISLANSPFYYQPRTLEIEPVASRGRKYKVVKKKKRPGAPQGSDEDDDAQDDDASDESSEEDEEEDDEDNENNEEESMDVPPWEELFPEEDKNTGTFDDPPQAQGGGGSLANLPTGSPAPQNSGSLLSLLTGGYANNDGPQSDAGGPPQQQYGQPPPQYRQGPPPPYQAVRARTSLPTVEEPRSGGAVLYDGYSYIPVKPIPVRRSKNINIKTAPEATGKARSLVDTPKTPRKKKQNSAPKKPKYIYVPVQRDSREIRFARDQHGFQIESGPMFAPSEIWRWEGPGGKPKLRRRDNRPSKLYYAPRPQRGSGVPTIRFADDSDY